MDAFELSALALVGVVTGWVNTLAGGGSMLTVPALMFFGLPADVANATNRIAIVVQCATGVWGYRAQGQLEKNAFVRVVPSTLLGAAAGALPAMALPNRVFRPILLGSLLLMAITLVAKPSFLSPSPHAERGRPGLLAVGALLLSGFYGGFIQAGVGLILIGVLTGMLGYDLVRANALKLAVVLAFSLVAVAVFMWGGLIQWWPAFALALGSAVGARLGCASRCVVAPKESARWYSLRCSPAVCG